MQVDGLQVMIPYLNDSDEQVRSKVVLCLSCAVRNNWTVLQAFLALNGFHAMLDACKHGERPIMKRILFLLQGLLMDPDDKVQTSVRDMVHQEQLQDWVIPLLDGGDLEFLEMWLEFLLVARIPDIDLTATRQLLDACRRQGSDTGHATELFNQVVSSSPSLES